MPRVSRGSGSLGSFLKSGEPMLQAEFENAKDPLKGEHAC
jgi:hypothetical protein